MAQKPALGKGLASLFPNVKTPQTSTHPSPTGSAVSGAMTAGTPSTVQQQEVKNKDRHPGISIASLDEIVANPYQPRRAFDETALEELAQSIRENGIIQPLIVRKTSNGYELIAGERRFRAAKKAGLTHVPIVIRKSTDRESLELALVENIQRSDLNCVDEALAYFQLMEEFSLTQEEVAKRVGKDRATVANHLRLLRLPEDVRNDLKKGALTFGHGKALCALDDRELCLRARKEIITNQLSVRETESLISELKNKVQSLEEGGASQRNALDPVKSRLSNLAQELTRLWATKVELKGSERKGRIVIRYGTREELERLISAMQNKDLWPNLR